MPKRKYEVIVKTSAEDAPEKHEMSAAIILAYHFKSDVIFLRPQTDRTPDIEVKGVRWEIKSPKGNGKKTIENNLRNAHEQSHNVVIDLRRLKMHQSKANARMRHFLSRGHKFKRVIIITKSNKIVEIL
jgi:hypothetical protein